MFRRRRSSSHHHQPLSASSSQSAHTAATHAFLRAQPSSMSLSSAAAAAALRSLTPTPTSPENVQTKRMMRRRSSISSQTNGAPGSRPASSNGLRRMGSSGSMTTRTFRDQSPRRPATSSGPVDVVPPMPSVPQAFARKGSNRRSVSLDTPMRTPSLTKQPSGRAGSVDRHATSSPTSPSHRRVSSLDSLPEDQKSGRRSSINFSYPITSRPNSPPGSPVSVNDNEPSKGPAVHSSEAAHAQNSISQVANKPMKRKTKTQAPGHAEGSHFSTGTAGGRAMGTAIAAAQAVNWRQSDTNRSTGTAPAHVSEGTISGRGWDIGKASDAASRDWQETSEMKIAPARVDQAAQADQEHPSRPVPRKRPSTVREDQEGEERAEADTAVELTGKVHGGNLSKDIVDLDQDFHSRVPLEAVVSVTSSVVEKAAEVQMKQAPASPRAQQSTELRSECVQSHVRQSSSPGRSAHFSNRLSVTGDILHEPPPRSVSPAKSALKHSPKGSWSPDRRTGFGSGPPQAPSEISDVTSIASDEAPRVGYRKRPAKVSFDDEAEIVGVTASPPTSPEDYLPGSPQVKGKLKSPWFGLGKRSQQYEHPGEEFGDVLKPRPALPSFGSIRGSRDSGEQIPTRDNHGDDESLDSSSSDAVMSNEPLSSDHAIGGILSNTAKREEKDVEESIAADSTCDSNGSAENTGYAIHPSSAFDLDFSGAERTEKSIEVQEKPVMSSPERETESDFQSPSAIPAISVQPASPELEKERPSLELYRPPGSFPLGASEATSRVCSKTTMENKSYFSPASCATPAQDEHEPADDDSSESVYSDAPEDWNDTNGDGFGSINAIVDCDASPIGLALGTPNEHSSAGPDLFAPANPVPSENSAEPHYDAGVGTNLPEELSGEPPSQIRADRRALEDVDQQAIDFPASSVESVPASPPYSSARTKAYAQADLASQNALAQKAAKRPESSSGYGSSPPHETISRSGHTAAAKTKQSENAVANQRQGANRRAKVQRPVSLDSGPPVGEMRTTRSEAPYQLMGRPIAPARTMSNGSDSSSSFKRSRRSSKLDGSFGMRRTMRPDALVAQSPPVPSRSMRTSLRSGAEQKSSRFMGSTKMSKAKPQKTSGRHLLSRFDESDDEGGNPQARSFRSRFADSSDEDEPTVRNLRPVRGIPRRQGADDGDSTELEDSSEDEGGPPIQRSLVSPANPKDLSGLAAVARSRGMTKAELEDFLNQPSRGRRSGILGLFRRSGKPPDVDYRIRKSNLESPSRRDTHLERTRQELEQLRRDPATKGFEGGNFVTTVTAGAVEPPPPRLQRRLSKRQTTGESWPLRAQPLDAAGSDSIVEDGEPQRPQTSDGLVRNGNAMNDDRHPSTGRLSKNPGGFRSPSHGNTSPTPDNVSRTASDVVISGSGQKKRFSLLRKAFGLRA